MRGVEGMVLVNGVPVDAWIRAGVERAVHVGDVSTWLRPGSNRLTTLLQQTRGAPSSAVRLVVEGPSGEALATLEVGREKRAQGFQHASFELPKGLSTELWTRAESLTKDVALDAEARMAYERAVHCILSEDFEGLAALRFDRGPLASPLVLRELVQSALLVPLPTRQLRTELGGDGRILSVWRAQRSAPFKFVDRTGKTVFTMCFHLARVDGELRWIR